jgi:hypothetical protein
MSFTQNHISITFPIKSPADAKAIAEELPALMPDFAKAQDAVGSVHYSRFLPLDDATLIFLADIDGEPEKLSGDLAKSAGQLFDAIFKHVVDPPPTAVASNSDAFIKWVKQHSSDPLIVYSAFENASVQDIKSAARTAGFTGNSDQHPLLISLPMKSKLKAFVFEEIVLKAASKKMTEGADSVGTLHFAHFVPLADTHLGFFTIFDGTFEKYIGDFTEKIGPVFDLMFKYVSDPPPTPVAKNAKAFLDYSGAMDRTGIGYYSAYPGLAVQDIRALLADAKAGPARAQIAPTKAGAA